MLIVTRQNIWCHSMIIFECDFCNLQVVKNCWFNFIFQDINSLTTIDMSINFLSFSSELRNKIYEQILMNQKYIDFFTLFYLRLLTPEFFRTNNTVCREINSLLYVQNRFNFVTCDFEFVISFVNQIDRNNANHIRHIRIDFLDISNLDRHDITFENNFIRILIKIRSDCINLSTLTTFLSNTNVLTFDALDNFNFVVETLALIDVDFKIISFLQKIIVEMYNDELSVDIKRKMKNYGWTISITKQAKESDIDKFFNDFENDGDDYDDNNDDYDYDIDDDSDFWKRAANWIHQHDVHKWAKQHKKEKFRTWICVNTILFFVVVMNMNEIRAKK